MSIYNDIENWNKNNQNECWKNAAQIAQYARDFKTRYWTFLGPGEEKSWYGSMTNKADRERDSTAKILMHDRQERALCFQVLISIVKKSGQMEEKKRNSSLQRRNKFGGRKPWCQ